MAGVFDKDYKSSVNQTKGILADVKPKVNNNVSFLPEIKKLQDDYSARPKTPTNSVGVNSSVGMQNKVFENTTKPIDLSKPKTTVPKMGYQGPVATQSDRLGYLGNTDKAPYLSEFDYREDNRSTPTQIMAKYKNLLSNTNISQEERNKLLNEGIKSLNDIARQNTVFKPKINGTVTQEQIVEAMKLRDELQRQSQGGAGVLGFINKASLEILETNKYNQVLKNITGLSDEDLPQSQLTRAQVSNPKAYTTGAISGDLVKNMALYSTVGNAVGSGVNKLPIVQSTISKITKPILQKTAQFGVNLASQQLTDTIVQTPFVIARGIDEGKSAQEIIKDVGKQQFYDFMYNVAIGTVDEAYKAYRATKINPSYNPKNNQYFKDINNVDDLKKAYKQQAKIYHPDLGGSTDAFAKMHDEYEQMLDYLGKNTLTTNIVDSASANNKSVTNSLKKVENISGIEKFSPVEIAQLSSHKGVVDIGGDSFASFVNLAKGSNETQRFYFGKVSPTLATQISDVIGKDLTGYKVAIKSDEIRHIFKKHGDIKTEAPRGQLAVTDVALSKLPKIFENPDEIIALPTKDYAGRQAFELRKWINGYAVVVNGISDGRNSIEIDSFRVINKKKPIVASDIAMQSQTSTPETSNNLASSINTSVAQPQTSVNTNSMQNQQGIFGQNTVGAAESNPNVERQYFRESNILTQTKPKKQTFDKSFNEIQHQLRRKFIDSGDEFARAGAMAHDENLYPMYNNTKQARQIAESMIAQAQTDINGDVVGKSLADIFKPVLDKGSEYEREFSAYLLNIHHIDRMAQNKPVFGETTIINKNGKTYHQFVGRPIDEATNNANELLRKHPEFESIANEVYRYNQNLMQYRIDTGLVSKEQAEIMNEMYPYYVPTFRDKSAITGSKASRGSASINQGIKKATGSSLDILPIHESMARQTMQTIQAGKRNLLAKRLFDDAIDSDKLNEIVQEITVADEFFDTEANLDEMPELRNTFKFYDNGKSVTMKVNSELYEGIKAISSTDSDYGKFLSLVKGGNDIYKKLITAYNPLFIGRNFLKDIQDVGLYSRDVVAFARNYPKAVAQIKDNSRLWQKYQALGGFGSSVFNYERGYKTEAFNEKSLGQKALDKIEALNYAVEQAPRFAEFLSVVEKGGEGYNNLMQAMYAAADVTVNFGRSGTWGKTLNSTFVPFFNPSVQGFSKMARTLTSAKGAKAWSVLVIRCVVLGILPSVLNELIYGDDEEYKYIHNRDKDNNYLFKIDNDKWLKIPKGRALAVFGNAGQRLVRQINGDENAWAGYIGGVVDNIAPVNPFTSNISAPVLGVMNNRTWYGTPIEPERLSNLPYGERYDENTDYFSKWLGGILNYSPKKINYLLDSYSGVLGDFILPLATPRAEQNPIAKTFILDSTMSNKISSNFYDKIAEIDYLSNSERTSAKDRLVFELGKKHLNKQASAVAELNKEIRAIENSNKLNSEKKEEVKEIKAVINGIQKNALITLPAYEKSLIKYSSAGDEMAYIMTNRDVFGVEYALKTYNKKVYENAVSSGTSLDNFFLAYFATKNIKSNKDYKGNTIPLSEGRNKKQAIDNLLPYLPLTEKQKLYKALGIPNSVW